MVPNPELTAHWAPVDHAVLAAALHDAYGLSGKLTRLTSERDETFMLAGDHARYTVKLANPAEDIGALTVQAGVLRHLHAYAPNVPVPRCVGSLTGAASVTLPLDGGRILRVLTWLDGEPLCRLAPDAGQTRQIGAALARLDLGLASYMGPVPQEPLLWDISHICDHAALADGVDARWHDLVRGVLDEVAAAQAEPLAGQLIHNDFNPYNVLVDPCAADFVTGIIDFGDIVHAPRINDLAVAAAYHLARPDWGQVAGALIGGYHGAARLTASEQAILPVKIAARAALTLMITEWRAGLHPENRDYILRNHPAALDGLRRLMALSAAERQAWVARICEDVT